MAALMLYCPKWQIVEMQKMEDEKSQKYQAVSYLFRARCKFNDMGQLICRTCTSKVQEFIFGGKYHDRKKGCKLS